MSTLQGNWSTNDTHNEYYIALQLVLKPFKTLFKDWIKSLERMCT